MSTRCSSDPDFPSTPPWCEVELAPVGRSSTRKQPAACKHALFHARLAAFKTVASVELIHLQQCGLQGRVKSRSPAAAGCITWMISEAGTSCLDKNWLFCIWWDHFNCFISSCVVVMNDDSHGWYVLINLFIYSDDLKNEVFCGDMFQCLMWDKLGETTAGKFFHLKLIIFIVDSSVDFLN